MAIAAGLAQSPLPLPRSRRRAPLQLPARSSRLPAGPPLLRPCRASLATPPPPLDDYDEPPKSQLDLALLLAAAVAVAVANSPQAAIAASGGAMGGRSYSSSSRSSSSSTPSYSSSSRSSSSTSSSSSFSSSYSSSYSSSRPNKSSSSSSLEQQIEATHVSVGTASPPRVYTAAEREANLRFWGYLASASVSAVAMVLAVRRYTRPRTPVVKLQVALLGLAKSFQKDLNEIAEKVEESNQRWYKFILTETICSLCRHNNCCISSSLSVNVKDKDSWEQNFDKISIEERSKFDEETMYNLEGIKRKKSYSKKLDGFRNEYIVLTILIAADGALKLPDIRNYGDLKAVVEKLNSIQQQQQQSLFIPSKLGWGKLNSIPATQIQGIQVLWTPQDESDVLSEERLLEDYPYLKPLSDD
ncbi:hypothetical protein PR202_gb28946 [Eleusine coracana subsp. coracana]|uniref:Uncharacterized protein n=1 Tax=Eleusine coracana subsp. coracana TaxID=191504 RepID=A0AAV5FVX8_ELECO|nr:hypothetical protein QOZ80_8BG0643300 [Eleusine coracana subsp. coracana]GJN39804.1 hypothetical protein PR202_gb28946 [Eleusine coracana subsp. coracana]